MHIVCNGSVERARGEERRGQHTVEAIAKGGGDARVCSRNSSLVPYCSGLAGTGQEEAR